MIMITSSQLRQTRDKLSSVAGPIVSSELPKWKVDIHGLLEYAEKKGVAASQLTDEEQVMFITECNN